MSKHKYCTVVMSSLVSVALYNTVGYSTDCRDPSTMMYAH